jgi:hypothetical protein
MLVQQEGVSVEIHVLQSTKGGLLNGKTGTQHMSPFHTRGGAGVGAMVCQCCQPHNIKIQNLKARCDVHIFFLGSAHQAGQGGGQGPELGTWLELQMAREQSVSVMNQTAASGMSMQ